MLTNQELRTMKKKDLLDELTKARADLNQTRLTVKTKHEKNTSLVQKQKRYIARVKTMIREVELEEAVEKANQID